MSKESIAEAVQITCVFDRYVSPDGKLENHQIEIDFIFNINPISYEGLVVGSDTFPVQVIPGSESVSFIEETLTGAIQSTTVLMPSGSAVHSRHTVIFGEIVPTQYYGSCH